MLPHEGTVYCDRRDQGDDAYRHPGRTAAQSEEEDQDRGPHQIELFFDTKRPELAQAFGNPEGVPYRVPVRVVEDGGEDRRRLCVAREVRDRRVDGVCSEEQEERGKQSQRAPHVERPKAHAPVVALLSEQQGTDKKSAQHEEQIDTDEATRGGKVIVDGGNTREPCTQEPEMEREHQQHGDATEPVESRNLAQPTHRWNLSPTATGRRLRKGSSQRGIQRFVGELVARVRRAGATGALVVRGDSGFFSYALIDTLGRLGVGFSITLNVNAQVREAIDGISEADWTSIEYPDGGEAAVAETRYVTSGRSRGGRRELRLVVRRTRLVDPAQAGLWPDWRYHAFITRLDTPLVEADEFHRDHASVELAIRDLKEGAGLEHCPSGHFFANAAWLACAVLAHNLYRWTTELGDLRPNGQLTVARTIRTRLLDVPGRLVNHAGRWILRLPARWPWSDRFLVALTRLRALQPVPT